MIARYLPPFAFALFVTLCLFYLMQALVLGSRSRGLDDAAVVEVDFSRAVTETEAQTKDRTLPEKTPPPAPPTPPSLSIAQAPKARAPDMPTLVPRLVRDLRLAGGLELGEPVSDSDAIPLVRIEPRYPSRAQARGIEGWVRVIFTISPAGTVVDEYIADSDPPRIFDSAALRAVRKWKYKPRIVNGKPVERRDVEVTLRFEIED